MAIACVTEAVSTPRRAVAVSNANAAADRSASNPPSTIVSPHRLPSVFHTPLAVATTRSPTTSSPLMKTSERVRRTTCAFGFDELADLNRVDEMHVELDGRLRLALVGVPAGHAHRAVGERHQHAALHDAAAVVVLRARP